MKKIRFGLLKAVPVKWDKDANFEVFCKFAVQAALRGAELFITPECFLDGYCVTDANGQDFDRDRFLQNACEQTDGAYIKETRRLAKKHKIHIVFGFSERVQNGAQNSAALITSAGEIAGIYHKTHLQGHDSHYIKGDSIPVFETALGRFGILICADRRWPEAARTLRLKGAEIILNPTYGMRGENNDKWISTRAYENEVPYIFCHPELAVILKNDGETAARLFSNVPDILVHDLEFEPRPASQSMFSFRTPDLYEILSKE